jgi:hypothetical protein
MPVDVRRETGTDPDAHGAVLEARRCHGHDGAADELAVLFAPGHVQELLSGDHGSRSAHVSPIR